MERDVVFDGKEWNTEISTHTLTWSVTGNKLWEFVAGIHFNSHAHVERDPTIENDNYRSMDFNSHAHVERDEK